MKQTPTALFIINTEGQVHTWKNVIALLEDWGWRTRVLARDYHSTLRLLEELGIEHVPAPSMRFRAGKPFELASRLLRPRVSAMAGSADVVVGFGVDAALLAFLHRKPCVVFSDSECVRTQNRAASRLGAYIVTPHCFEDGLGHRHSRVLGYKELAYLHPDRFRPAPSPVGTSHGMPPARLFLLRLNAFAGFHDIGARGISSGAQRQLVGQLSGLGTVLVSSESPLPHDLKPHAADFPLSLIHDAIWHANLVVCDTGTMATEAAVLGTPVVHCRTLAGSPPEGNFRELAEKYHLLIHYPADKEDEAVQAAIRLASDGGAKEEWRRRRDVMLEEMEDVALSLARRVRDAVAPV